jgi:hypothetical protein
MRTCNTILALVALTLAAGAVQAASRQAVLRMSLTIVDHCNIRDDNTRPRVDCSAGLPWLLAPAVAANAASAPSLISIGERPSDLPVPRQADGARVTTIVF